MDPTNNPVPASSTFPPTEAVKAIPTQTAEEEAAALLLMLMETAGALAESAHHEFYLDHFVGSPLPAGSSRFEGKPDLKVALETTVSKAQEDSTNEYHEECDQERLKEGADEVLKLEDGPPVLPEVRRCNRSSGQGWFCGELAHDGYAVCLKHMKIRREYLQKKRAKKLRASTGSEASFVPWIEGRATSAGDQEEKVGVCSPKPLARAKRSEVARSVGSAT